LAEPTEAASTSIREAVPESALSHGPGRAVSWVEGYALSPDPASLAAAAADALEQL